MIVPDTIAAKVRHYYRTTLGTHGATPKGVDWNSSASQTLRFEQLMRVLDGPDRPSINDVGCGYGALAWFLADRGMTAEYHGSDLCLEMIEEARRTPPVGTTGSTCSFSADPRLMHPADYTVASGIFNVRLDITESDWQTYMSDTIVGMFDLSIRGMAFNALSMMAVTGPTRSDLFFADPHQWFDFCRRLSNRVALLHDYPLCEFTILVRKR